ncbi:unnamed protein product [Rhodiola kirilowii]
MEESNEELARLQLDNDELRQTVADLRRGEAERKKIWMKEPEAKKVEEVRKDYRRKFARPGLGYVEVMKDSDEEATNKRIAKGKGLMTEVGESSCQEKKSVTSRQSERAAISLEESHLYDSDSVPFKARKAFEIWKKHSSNRQPFSIDF